MGQKKGFFIILISVLIFVILAGVIFLASRNPARTALPANPSPAATQAQGRSDFCVPDLFAGAHSHADFRRSRRPWPASQPI